MDGQLLQAGTTSGTVSFPGQHTRGWMILATTAVALTVTFNGSTSVTVNIPSFNAQFVEIGGDFQSITVSGGTASYIVMG